MLIDQMPSIFGYRNSKLTEFSKPSTSEQPKKRAQTALDALFFEILRLKNLLKIFNGKGFLSALCFALLKILWFSCWNNFLFWKCSNGFSNSNRAFNAPRYFV